jgi:hypothetical protein
VQLTDEDKDRMHARDQTGSRGRDVLFSRAPSWWLSHRTASQALLPSGLWNCEPLSLGSMVPIIYKALGGKLPRLSPHNIFLVAQNLHAAEFYAHSTIKEHYRIIPEQHALQNIDL